MTDEVLLAFVKSLYRLPVYTAEFLVQTVIAVCSDFTMTSLLLGSVALWLATNVWWAVTLFFVLLVMSRVVNSIANAIGTTGHNMAMAMRQQSQSQSMSMVPVPVNHERVSVVASEDGIHT